MTAALMADTILEGLTETEVQHVREKAENLLAEIKEIQRTLNLMRKPPYATPAQVAAHVARKTPLLARLDARQMEYRPLRDALKNWNIRQANQNEHERFRDIRDTALRAVSELHRRCDEDPIGWMMFADEQLVRSLNDLLDAGKFYVGQDATDDERFTLLAAPRQQGVGNG